MRKDTWKRKKKTDKWKGWGPEDLLAHYLYINMFNKLFFKHQSLKQVHSWYKYFNFTRMNVYINEWTLKATTVTASNSD